MIETTHQISAVRRTVGSRTLEAGEARVLTISQTYRATLDDLWDACTNVDRIPRWFLPISGDLRLHGRYQFEGNAGGVVERCDPPKSFAATWEMGGEVSWIEVRLTPEGEDRTRFTLEHVAHVDDERWTEYGPGAVGVGWDSGLLGLAGHLDPDGGDHPRAGRHLDRLRGRAALHDAQRRCLGRGRHRRWHRPAGRKSRRRPYHRRLHRRTAGLTHPTGVPVRRKSGRALSVPAGTLCGMPMRRAEDVLALHRAGRPVKYLCFWGHRPRRDGTVGQSCLSQWWPAPFTVDGRHFPTAEHWMMWRKALLFGDTEAGERVLAAAHPHRAKAIGREVRHFDPAVWEAERYAIVLAGSLAKFGQHADLRAYLLGTGERVLVEASPVDRVWGSVWPPTTRAPRIRPAGAGSTCSASP